MFQFKPLDPKAVPKALEKAERYRSLNEPEEAESICLDILAIEPDSQQALIMLMRARSARWPSGGARCFGGAQALLPKRHGACERFYYAGLRHARRGNRIRAKGGPGSSKGAYEWFQGAMPDYRRAEALRPPHNHGAT